MRVEYSVHALIEWSLGYHGIQGMTIDGEGINVEWIRKNSDLR